MSDARPDDLQHVVPVPPTGNGHKVRPDFQTKIVSAIVIAIILYMGKSIGDKVDDFGNRITRIEAKVEERFKSQEEQAKLTAALWAEKVDRMIDKLDEANRRLEALEKKGDGK